MAEQQTARPTKKASDSTGGSVATVSTVSTPIFDELLREMTAQQAQPSDKQVESRHRAT